MQQFSATGEFIRLWAPADDVPVPRTARYQAAGCRGLGFKPRLRLAPVVRAGC